MKAPAVTLSFLNLGRKRPWSSSVLVTPFTLVRSLAKAEWLTSAYFPVFLVLSCSLSVRELLRSWPIVLMVLAVPIIPFVLLGGRIDEWFEQWQQDPPSPRMAALAIIALLASDIFLPIPSSMVSTFGGGQLGWLGGTLASWIGMNLGSFLGFALARWLGPSFTRWFTRRESLSQMSKLSEQYGPSVIVLTRGVPVLAEASILLLGLERLSWRKFLPPLLLSNLGLALAYSAFGDFAKQYNSVPLALAISILLPVFVAAVVQRRLRRATSDESQS